MSSNPSYRLTPVTQLANKSIFDSLSTTQKLYAHHMSLAAWYGARIVLRQNSAEALGIFEFIMKLHNASGGKWRELVKQGVTSEDVDAFLEYSGQFLSSLGNYFEIGNKKAVPALSMSALRKMAQISPDVTEALDSIIGPMFSIPPEGLGYPSERLSSNYYLGEPRITKEEISSVAKIMERNMLEPENTRIHKSIRRRKTVFEILQASADQVEHIKELDSGDPSWSVVLSRGDHALELAQVCSQLEISIKYAENKKQREVISYYIRSFRSGSLEAYRKSQKAWVTDIAPMVETNFGFVEPYKDPAGVRGEWQGIVSISNKEESAKMQALVEKADKLIRTLPWVTEDENDGNGPFEATRCSYPDFSVVYSLAYVSSTHWEAQNLPNASSKNTLWVNRMSANKDPDRPCSYVHPDERKTFRSCNHIVRFIVTALHELLGHGTGKLLSETSQGEYNFNRENPPINPLTGRPIETWYGVGQTWTSVFGEIAPSADECRAMLVSYYLVENIEILSVFGYHDTSEPKAGDVVYYAYLHIGVEGLLAMAAFNTDTKVWGSPHAQANFAILKHVLEDGNKFMVVDHNSATGNIYIRVDRHRIVSDGKSALGPMLMRLHIYRCTADVAACKEWYESLSAVDGIYEKWRNMVVENPEPKWKFIQGNTFLGDKGEVELKIYDSSNEGIIKSFAERNLVNLLQL
ncbi:hypothetical protein GQX73_g10281 [Xylaria multiplex]|uniref:Dipeptidyl aminopeptidase III n=1 Tax=Xylaria multiplex TaxID=323545 RepID=A0A7C8MK34_9PEZI|nr:hypothetical protein GQX73_g10281 [Xylaria multiplex]